MYSSTKRPKLVSKGERLNWTPIKDVQKVTLKSMNINGKLVTRVTSTLKVGKTGNSDSKLIIP